MRLVLPCLFFLTSNLVHSQNEAVNWYFGSQAGLHFNFNRATPIANSKMFTQEGCAVISDKRTGELLFYSNGRNVWNKKHQLMPNGQDFPVDCWSSITQSALIVPFPGDDSKFYLFSIFYSTIPGGNIFIEKNCTYGHSTESFYRDVRYSIIDMTKNEGLGEVIEEYKLRLLKTNVTEKLTAVPHSNGEDYWIIVHEFEGNGFYVYPLTENGIGEPVVTKIGSFHESKPDLFFRDEETRGYMKASPEGSKIACAVASGKRPFDLFDFNQSTGELSNYINLGLVQGQYGLSFSPDNSKLYVTSDDRPQPTIYPYPDIIIQFDLKAGDVTSIINSRKSIIRNNPLTNLPLGGTFDGFLLVEKGLQLGIDGKLYVTGDYAYSPSDGQIMVVIERPNELGFKCQINYQRFNFGIGQVGSGLPNFIQSYFNGIESSSTCGDSENISIYPNPTYGNVHIKFPEGCQSNALVKIFSSIGQEISNLQIDKVSNCIDISNLSPGVYIFFLSTIYNKKIIKRIIKV
jgi:hypothetical protein